jgi:hypothetical protein
MLEPPASCISTSSISARNITLAHFLCHLYDVSISVHEKMLAYVEHFPAAPIENFAQQRKYNSIFS